MTNSGTPLPRLFGLMESCAQGVVVPRPRRPTPVVELAVSLRVEVPLSCRSRMLPVYPRGVFSPKYVPFAELETV